MKGLKQLIAVGAVLTLGACSGYHSQNAVEELNKTEATGSAFTKFLANEYRAFANSEHTEMFDYPDALHFAKKGLAAANGEVVMPETLDNWKIGKSSEAELLEAREGLVAVLESGARNIAASNAALAQVKYDCWVEQQEENFQKEHIAVCKEQFFKAMGELQEIMKMAQQPEIPAPVEAADAADEVVPLEQAMYLVFFDWNKSSITTGAKDVLDAVVAEVKGREDVTTIVVRGHTDSSGSSKYNDKLSMKRAHAVRDALIVRGLSKDLVRVEAKGETDLLVATKDDVREGANRRAQITFE